MGECFNIRTMEGFFPALALKTEISVFPCLSLTPHQLLFLCQNPGWMPESERICACSVLREFLCFQPFQSHLRDRIWLIFIAICCGGCYSWHLCSKLGSLVWGLGPLLFMGDLCSKNISSNSWLPTVCATVGTVGANSMFHVSTSSLEMASSLYY